ncbi:MAG: hypothetical protein WA277_08510 [Nitrospirota bacterium]
MIVNQVKRRGVWQYAPTIIIFFLLSACTQKVCEVGDINITDKDISLRKKVSEVYYPNSGKDYVALSQLINGYLSEEILKSLGHKVDDAILKSEAKRIDENTKAPEILKKIKDIYGRNRDAYIKTFVRIVYAERALYNEIFLKSKEIHKNEYQNAENIIKEGIASKKPLREIAKEKGLRVVKLKVFQKGGIAPFGEEARNKPNTGIGLEQAGRLIDAVSTIKEGEVYPEIIEWLEGYQVIKYIRKEKDIYIIDSVSIPKRSYDDWFWERAVKIPVKIYDEKQKGELLKEVSWTKNLKLQ